MSDQIRAEAERVAEDIIEREMYEGGQAGGCLEDWIADALEATARLAAAPVYEERNRLVAYLAALLPSSLERHEGDDWEDDWRWVVYIQTPQGQLSWHIHDSQLPLFDHVPRNQGVKWDGHTTEEKYERIRRTIEPT